jgi:hypothetical protein
MKNSFIYSMVSLVSVALLQSSALSAAEITPTLLRYGIEPDQTNAYKLQIESQGESGREAMAGNFTVSSRSVGSNLIGLTFRGQLQPKNIPGRPSMMGFYRPGNGLSLSAYTTYPSYSGEGKELVIDNRGRVLREAGDVALPIPLGELIGSLLEKFPAEPSREWEQEEDAFVLDEPLLQGPAHAFLNSSGRFPSMNYPGQPGQGAQGVLTVRQKTKVRLMEVTPQTVSLQKTFSLESYVLTGAEPRVSATGQGKFDLDRATGWPKRVELECKTVAVTEHLSRRSIVSLRWELLEGAEREAELAPPPPPPLTKAKLSAEEVAKLMGQLKSDEMGTRQSAARELGERRLDNPGPEILSVMVLLANDPDDTVRHTALTILANHGTTDHVPLLIKALHNPDSRIRTTAIRGLARLKDPRAAEPLADLLASGQGDQQYFRSRASEAADALVKIGPASEAAALAILKEKNIETRAQACVVLKQIGTKKSLGILKDLTLSPHKELSEAAAEACRSIQGREDQ